ncbi:MAG TPA: LysE family transporter [Verrucomicrobiae bacterium]|nr:LysE family transporter [Verrucomicrobiae bacterium]
MEDAFIQLAIAWLTGLVSGFVVSMPIGPTNITIINEAARRGFLRGWLVGLGAVTMDMAYCTLGLAGFAHLFESRLIKAAMELISFMLLAFLGFKYWHAATINTPSRGADALTEKIHPSSAYMTGLVRVLGNPGVLLLWIALTANFVAGEWVDPPIASKLLCILGVGLGATAWFALLSWGVSRGHGKFSDKTLLRLEHFSGLLLMGGAAVIGLKLVILLSQLKH